MDWDFGDIILTMLAFFFWFTFIWMFIGAFTDVLRRSDLSGWAKAGWIALITILPLLGVLVYMVTRPVPTEENSLSAPRVTDTLAPTRSRSWRRCTTRESSLMRNSTA